MIHFKKFFIVYLGLFLLFLSISASYVRFMTLDNYKVFYFIPCNPYVESCFMDGCYEDVCLEELVFYKKIERLAKNLRFLCEEESVLTCEKANYCINGEEGCLVEICVDNIGDVEKCAFFAEENPYLSKSILLKLVKK